MYQRHLLATLNERLGYFPGVVMLGPRQAGKTTLARQLASSRPDALFLDLERPGDRAALAEPELFLRQNRHRLVILDEVQNLPDLFAVLRPEIDDDRRPGRFLLLGSASGKLLRQSAESLAGRVSYLELTPLLASEVRADATSLSVLLLRGGFPPSYDAPNEALSLLWREEFIRTILERDLPQLGVTTPASTLDRFWRMLAHLHGQQFNASQLGLALGGASHSTVGRYLDLLQDALLVRRLEPLTANLGKRLVKTPKAYVRDSGLLHALLGIGSINALHAHPVVGASWEGFVIEQIAAHAPAGADLCYFRTAAGAELDLVLTLGGKRHAFEMKYSTTPKPARGFWTALNDLAIDRAWVVAPVEHRYPLARNVDVIPVQDVPRILATLSGDSAT
ncbi:MAG: ATPase [Hydrogenophilales bacterium CG17_big_fil_post_rev_8_21_14_2_50_63_12]|nr:MAG: ATPase [Hydrogenophilales bacterium CG17_big_fil_post_rev_8_21_14_2_50_63_12]PIX97945.1 MAG: ATPase [Hydrogenophilales bacterium CG_4_10_14_3_um_filter_63_21]